MLSYKELLNISDTIKNDFPDESKDFVDAFEWLSLAMDGVLSKTGSQLASIHQSGDFEKIIELSKLSKTLTEIQKEIKGFSDNFVTQAAEDEENEMQLLESELDEKGSLPDYSQYAVDRNIAHSLYENFTHTRACGFEFQNTFYEARNMRDVLVQTCTLLYQIDPNKLQSFIQDPTMKGRKISYFGTQEVIEDSTVKNEAVPGTSIYVWVNLSCNHIRNIIMKMLKKYGISFNEFKVYLRADYKELHTPLNSSTNNIPNDGDDKIGKHVTVCIRKLSNINYKFNSNELLAMQSVNWTKTTFGMSVPFIKKYEDNKDISEQIKINGNNRYWKELFILNGEKYFVASQWYEYHREKFNNWFNSFDI